jgi:hypothetical protein
VYVLEGSLAIWHGTVEGLYQVYPEAKLISVGPLNVKIKVNGRENDMIIR